MNTVPNIKSVTDGNDDLPVRPNSVRWILLGGLILIVAITIGTAELVMTFRERALNSTERELGNTLMLLGRHFDQQLEAFQDIQKDIVDEARSHKDKSRDEYRKRISSEYIHQMLKEKEGGSQDAAGVNIFDADGNLINSSEQWPIPPINVSDREYFKNQRQNSSSGQASIELVQSRFFSGWVIVFARRISSSDGSFLGIVTRGISPAYFEGFFASLALGQESTISMVLRSGAMLARHPHMEPLFGKDFKAAPLQARLSRGSHGTLRITSPVDGQERLGSVRALTDYPVSIEATKTVAESLIDWRAQTKLLIVSALLLSIVIGVTLLLIAWQISRQHKRAQRRLALEKQRLDVAINNMTPGLLLFDASQRLIVCNKRYIEMFGLSPNIIKPGCTLQELLAHGKARRSVNGDLEEYCAMMEQGKASKALLETPDGRSIHTFYQPLPEGGWVATLEDVTERRRTEKRITHLAHYDALTDLPNRVLFRETLERELREIGPDKKIAVLYIDLDGFKGVNDTLGHSAGDDLLKSVANRLRECIEEPNFVARLGGDEFAVVQIDCGENDKITGLIAQILEAVRQPFPCVPSQILADASIGVAIAPEHGTEFNSLLKNADLAMYAAKADGRRTYRFFSPDMEAQVKARHWIESDLRQIILEGKFEQGGFEVYYQPLVDMRTSCIRGCEALLRWRHPERGSIPPADFIVVAEDTGLIRQLGEWVLMKACADATSWPGKIRVAVNVSPVQFRASSFPLTVAATLAKSGLSPSRLELEITEAVLIRDDEVTLSELHQIRSLGARIALDDFGTGYSSLSYLHRFPFDKIKIDRSFVTDIAEAEGSAAIVQAVVHIARSRNMTTTAEGVETDQQREVLQTLGCTEMQGYLFSPALPLAEVTTLLNSQLRHDAA